MNYSFIALFAVTASASAQIVPAPQQLKLPDLEGVSGHIIHLQAPEFSSQMDAFVAALQSLGVSNARYTEDPAAQAVITFAKMDGLLPEAYMIQGSPGQLHVMAATPAGAAHATASLLQTVTVENGRATWPRMILLDMPDLPYRSFMIDMGRNPHAPATLRQVVDMMWMYKANYLHLHLSDDQLFSWPSQAFPKLYSARAGWTWEDFVALESYAQARGVTLIPEIDVPGHSTILRREYPDVFGVSSADLATSPAAQQGVETLLTELLSVFKATPYVHLGGDEAGGVPADDQRDFINRLNDFLKSKGKRTLVWEGPALGEGKHKVAEDVIQMNWHTVGFPAQEMLNAGYQVVNASWDPLYIVDHYPQTMFTAVDVERCYAWDLQRFAHVDPDIATFLKPHRTRSATGILGFCMPWWEGREENLLPLCLPRLAAVASAAWNRKGENDFEDFQKRQAATLPLLEKMAGIKLPQTPFATAQSQQDNLAFRATVTPSGGAAQPHFGPERLTNGLTDPFDHFLGFPTAPQPLEILIQLAAPANLSRVVVYETASGQSYEIYEVLVSADGKVFTPIGSAQQGSRGEENCISYRFPEQEVRTIKIVTQGCHGLTFPSFSRLCEVMAFAE